jgi:hypothetical protein
MAGGSIIYVASLQKGTWANERGAPTEAALRGGLLVKRDGRESAKETWRVLGTVAK